MKLDNEKRRIDILALNQKKENLSITACPQLTELLDQVCTETGLARGDLLFGSLMRLMQSYEADRMAAFLRTHGVYTRDDMEKTVNKVIKQQDSTK